MPGINDITTDLFFTCPHCQSEWFTIITKLPDNKILDNVPQKHRGVFVYPIDSKTQKRQMLFVCEHGHRFYYDEQDNVWKGEAEMGVADDGDGESSQ